MSGLNSPPTSILAPVHTVEETIIKETKMPAFFNKPFTLPAFTGFPSIKNWWKPGPAIYGDAMDVDNPPGDSHSKGIPAGLGDGDAIMKDLHLSHLKAQPQDIDAGYRTLNTSLSTNPAKSWSHPHVVDEGMVDLAAPPVVDPKDLCIFSDAAPRPGSCITIHSMDDMVAIARAVVKESTSFLNEHPLGKMLRGNRSAQKLDLSVTKVGGGVAAFWFLELSPATGNELAVRDNEGTWMAKVIVTDVGRTTLQKGSPIPNGYGSAKRPRYVPRQSFWSEEEKPSPPTRAMARAERTRARITRARLRVNNKLGKRKATFDSSNLDDEGPKDLVGVPKFRKHAKKFASDQISPVAQNYPAFPSYNSRPPPLPLEPLLVERTYSSSGPCPTPSHRGRGLRLAKCTPFPSAPKGKGRTIDPKHTTGFVTHTSSSKENHSPTRSRPAHNIRTRYKGFPRSKANELDETRSKKSMTGRY